MVTFGKIFEAWKAEKMLYVKESSMATYLLLAEKHLLPVFKDATEIKERDAQAFVIQKLQNGLSQKTTKDCIIVLRMILRYADKNDWWICRPWDLRYPPVKNVKKLSVMSQKEQKILMNYLAMNYSLRNLGILICLNTGMRIGEVCGLQWGDINLNERCITIARSVSRVYYPSSNGQHRTFLSIGTPKFPHLAPYVCHTLHREQLRRQDSQQYSWPHQHQHDAQRLCASQHGAQTQVHRPNAGVAAVGYNKEERGKRMEERMEERGWRREDGGEMRTISFANT